MKHRTLATIAFALAAVWIAVDQFSKYLAVTYLEPGVDIPLLGTFFQLRLVYNPGAAFGLGTGYIWILTVIAGIASIALGVIASRVSRLSWALVIGSMLGGAISHFFDRLLRGETFANGKIIDFLDYNGWFVGNIADIALVGAAIGAVLLSLYGSPFSEPEPRERETSRA